MARPLTRCNAHFRRAVRRLPLGVSSNFRYWGDDKTLYVKRGRGPRLWDLDDNEYIDYRLGYGPVILGHCHPEVDAAAREGQQVGTVFAMSTEREAIVAELIHEMVPAAELVRFSNSGTEAVMASLRLARGVTGRDGYVILEGSYHGLFDAVMWQADVEGLADVNDEPEYLPFGRGVPGLLRQLCFPVPYNDANRLEDVLRRNRDRIAAVLIEPILGSCCGIPATAEFFRAVRELTTRHDVLMIADEVKTGFRVARGGAQELHGVRADVVTMAKAMANGYPIAAIGGREDILRHYRPGDVTHGGTYTAGGMALAAAERTLRILRDTDALDRVSGYGGRMQDGMARVLRKRGIPHCFAGHPSMGGLFFREQAPTNYRDWKLSDYTFYDTLAQHLIENGVLCEPDSREPWFVSAAHDEACLEHTLRVFEAGVDATLRQLDQRAVEA
ncbi:MAG TPA: aspartate aminotransferase family protein [Vicinamibacteria bacterium]|nr:aspartate aminotransferase family protein [Vicinamibacteria bacterium]